MDLKSYSRWYDYSRARDAMFAATDTAWAPWYVAHTDDKKRGRLNIISHLLSQIPYQPLDRPERHPPQTPASRRLRGTTPAVAAHPHAVLNRLDDSHSGFPIAPLTLVTSLRRAAIEWAGAARDVVPVAFVDWNS